MRLALELSGPAPAVLDELPVGNKVEGCVVVRLVVGGDVEDRLGVWEWQQSVGVKRRGRGETHQIHE